MLHHVVLRLLEICGDVVVVLSPDAPEPTMPAGAPVRFARDAAAGEGPLAGTLAGLLAVRTERAVVAGGDMPDLQGPVLSELLRVANATPVDAVALREGDRVRPLPCVLRMPVARDAARALMDGGGRRLRDLLEALRVSAIDEATWRALDPEARTLIDVDEPGDLDDLHG
jgi:molybdopterin-guanine dinucleotide biosynthesis protein A